jgi:hypothetical protein
MSLCSFCIAATLSAGTVPLLLRRDTSRAWTRLVLGGRRIDVVVIIFVVVLV